MKQLCTRFNLTLEVIVLLHHPTSAKLQLADSRPDIILQDILVYWRIHFSFDNSKWPRPLGSVASPNHDAPSAVPR